MVRTRTDVVLAAVLLCAGAADARPRHDCRDSRAVVRFPSVCVGDRTVAQAVLCFGDPDRCDGSGFVVSVEPPDAPFALAGLRLEGSLGGRRVSEADLPIPLLPGSSVVAELSVGPTSPGSFEGRLEWEAAEANRLGDGTDGCPVELRAATPVCGGVDSAEPCVAEVCVAGACVERPRPGPCDDGDTCTRADVRAPTPARRACASARPSRAPTTIRVPPIPAIAIAAASTRPRTTAATTVSRAPTFAATGPRGPLPAVWMARRRGREPCPRRSRNAGRASRWESWGVPRGTCAASAPA